MSFFHFVIHSFVDVFFFFYREISLKILAHNNLIGRIIGKGGSTIKRVMLETETKITVSRYNHFSNYSYKGILITQFLLLANCSLNDVSSFNMERVITIKGTIENMSRAEGMISAKLRQSYESDLQAMAVRILNDLTLKIIILIRRRVTELVVVLFIYFFSLKV